MKFTVLLLAVTLLQARASIFAQKISLSVKDASLTEVITKIRMQTQIDILYNNSALSGVKPITIDAKNEDLKVVLNKCFKDQPLTYKMVGNTILITAKPEAEPAPVTTEAVVATAVTGKVTDEKGLPLPGVTVKVKNTQTAVSSGVNGSYKINVPDANAVLVFTFVGYEPQEIAVAGRNSINVSMKSQNTGLNEIVVVGYGTQKAKDLTGAVSALSSGSFNKGSNLAPQQLLQGKIAGVNIAQNSGKPGASNTVRIRGGTSLTGNNDPLYVIDGVPISNTAGVSQANIRGNGTDVFDEEPTNPLQTINANDIESISVLKDASATAIYGARAANGVIVITTKSGKEGKPQISYNGLLSMSSATKKLPMLTGDEYRAIVQTLPSPNNKLDDRGANTNWQDQVYRTAFSNDNNVSLSGATDRNSYRVSMGYGNQQGIVLNSNMQQANISTNLTQSALNKKLKFDLRLNYGQNKSNAAPISNTVGSELGSSLNYEAYVFNPTYPVYDANGAYVHSPPFRINPVSFTTDVIDQKTNQRLLGNLMTTYKIIDPLSISVSLGYTRQTTDRNSFISKNNPLGNGFNGYASSQKYYDYSKLSETILRYNQTFGKHTVEALAGYSYQYFAGEGDRIIASGFLSDQFRWYSLGAANVSTVSSFAESNKLISMYGRFNYNYDNRILVTGTLRRDGSSRFGANNKWGYFPSGSVGWRISQEKFFHVKPISDLKLRVSYGTTGNQEIGNLNSIVTLGSGSGYIVGADRVTIVLPANVANPNLKWESTSQLNIGLNFGLFGDRIHGTVDLYRKKTSDLLLQVATVQPAPVSTFIANVGSVENKGIEIELGATIVDHKDFNWDASLNFTRNINTVLSLSNDTYNVANIPIAPIQGTVSGGYAQLIMPGSAYGTFYGPRYTGVGANGLETYAAGGSQVIGSAQPKFTYGMSNTFTYKSWSLNFNLRGVYGNQIYNLTANNLGYKQSLPAKNALESVINDGVSYNQPKTFSSRWIESGSFLRLDNATLGYNIPLKTVAISSLRVFVTGQNLLLVTKYKGLDPEVNAEVSGVGVAPLGIDYLGYPRARTISLGASITFQ